jgi:glutamate 5-kinase
VPIFNANDTIETDEIRCYDNDKLAAYLVVYLNQDLLINLTVYDGLIRDGKTVEVGDSYLPERYDNLNKDVKEGRGGSKSKLESVNKVCE